MQTRTYEPGDLNFFILTNPSSCSPRFSTAQRGANQQSFPRPSKQIYLTHFQFTPDLHEEIQNSHGKQHLSSARPLGHYCQAKMCPKCGHPQASVHSLAATEGMAAFWKGACVKDSLSAQPTRAGTPFAVTEAASSGQMRARGSHAATPWRGSLARLFLLHPGLASLQRLLCRADRVAETPPAPPSEGRDCLIYEMGGKNKAPSLFVIWDEEEEESSLIFGS